jgi:hypothetical protein
LRWAGGYCKGFGGLQKFFGKNINLKERGDLLLLKVPNIQQEITMEETLKPTNVNH